MVLHEFPARMTDLICTLFGKDPFAVRLCNKMQKGMRSLEYFTTHQVRRVWGSLWVSVNNGVF